MPIEPEEAAGEASETVSRGGSVLRLQVAIAGVSGTLLSLQVAFTRVLSVVVNFHMVFLVLSAAMLGVGLPGAWLLWRPPGRHTVARALLVAAITIPASVMALLNFGSPDVGRTLPLAIVCLTVPFLALGTAAVALLRVGIALGAGEAT